MGARRPAAALTGAAGRNSDNNPFRYWFRRIVPRGYWQTGEQNPATQRYEQARQWSLLMSLGTILLIIVILILLGAVPAWPYSRGWGYGPSGIVGVLLVIVVILLLVRVL